MIHLVVVLSAVALTASDATPAVYPSTTHSLHTRLAVISPVTLCTMQHTMPTFATLPASGVIPHPPDISSASSVCLNTLNYFLFLTQLQSTEQLSPLLPLLQTSISNTTRVHACPWKQIWNTLMWLCLHTNLMKQTRAKYNKQPVQLHSNYRLNKQIPWPLTNSKRKKQAQNSKENLKQIQNVQVPKNSNKEIPQMQTPPDNKEITRTPAVTDNILESLSQTHQENNKEMPQTQKHTNSNKHILQTAIPQYDSKQELQTQSPAKNRQHTPQAQIPMVNRQRRQMMVFLESKQQIPQMPSDKNKEVIPHTLTDNSRQNQQTPTYRNKHIQQKKTLVGIRVKMPQTQTTSHNQRSVQQLHTHKSERKQLLEKTSDWMLHNNCLHIARNQPSVSYSLTAAPETAVPASRSWVGAQEHTSSTKSTLQALPHFAALTSCYGDLCKKHRRQLQQLPQMKMNMVKHQAVDFNFRRVNDRTNSAIDITGETSSVFGNDMLQSISDNSSETFNVDIQTPYSRSSMPFNSSVVVSSILTNILTHKYNPEMTKLSSLPVSDTICTKGFNRTCIFKRSTRIESSIKNSRISKATVKADSSDSGDGTFERENVIYGGITSDSILGNSTSEGGSRSSGSNILINRRASAISSTASTSNSSSAITNSINRKRGEHNKKRKNHKQGRMRRGRGHRRLDRKQKHQGRGLQRHNRNLALWIDRRQVKLFSGYMMEIYAIHNGRVLPYILDPNFEKQLPVIPSEVENVNFTWRAGSKKYYYTFDRLYSQDEEVLKVPVLSLPTHGRVPKKPKVFSVKIQCTGNASGIAAFGIGLLIQTRHGKPLPGTPLRLKLRKECTQLGPDPECDQKCENGGFCDEGQRCQCPEGYMGQYCNTALCYPQCMNGGTCTTPGRCSCPPGFQGRHCEGGICQNKCQNGGKCIQKDTCDCRRGYYGNRCEFSKCVIPCVNGGRCRDVNKCRCPHGFAGDHCEVVMGQDLEATATVRCHRRCRHGSCKKSTCNCYLGYTGRWCRRSGGSMGSRQRKKMWV